MNSAFYSVTAAARPQFHRYYLHLPLIRCRVRSGLANQHPRILFKDLKGESIYEDRIEQILVPSSSPTFQSSLSILHQVPEGQWGYIGEEVRKDLLHILSINFPGFHLKMHFIPQYESVQVTLQTDQMTDIPCGTKGDVMISFGKIEVIANTFSLIRYAPGIEIISVHVTKPTIPEGIRRTFEQMEEVRTKVLIAIEKHKVAEKEAETMKKRLRRMQMLARC
ncbi:hypothetical protein VNO78_11960 [Psophocarpus tetragonolobus]|uniref:Uncharacterized protein n=1 Tax=Psophocarpus tetragonolobus TaxID=3891 RepID=A0AAN9SM91_PSOTE